MKYTNYLERRAAFLGEGIKQVDETWKTKHSLAMVIFDLEAIYTDLVRFVDELFERDDSIHLQATKGKNEEILRQWESSFNSALEKSSKAINLFPS